MGIRALLLAAGISGSVWMAEAMGAGVLLTEQKGTVRVEINGEFFTDYVFEGAPHVYYYPVLGPGGLPMTRNWPMKEVAGEERDHKHHRSLWFSHGAVNGIDFWAEDAKAGRIVHDRFLEIKSGAESGVIRSANKWIAPNGEVVCTDERTFRVYARPANERLFDFEITLQAGAKEVVLGDTKEGSMAIRLNETLRLKHNKMNAGQPPGQIVMRSGVRDGKTWGQRSEWCDYSGWVNGKRVGIAIFDHPQNPVHPTWWHVRDYGLFAANPFGVHDFEKKPAGTGNFVIAPGKSVTFRYRFYIHEGDELQSKVAQRYGDYRATAR
jgi:hypothetical protein